MAQFIVVLRQRNVATMHCLCFSVVSTILSGLLLNLSLLSSLFVSVDLDHKFVDLSSGQLRKVLDSFRCVRVVYFVFLLGLL